MQPGRILCSALLFVTATVPAVSMSRSHRAPTAPKSHTKSSAAKRSAGQRSIDDARATEIQQALVKSGYMAETSGHWDSATESAMQKFQSDNGWQTKLVPDSRALIKLGLGPTSQATPSTVPVALSAGGAATPSDVETFGSK